MDSRRKILHLDLDAFFCAVEEQRDPALRGKAFAVGGQPDARGVVASCSYPARAFGVHSALSMRKAVQLCPHLIIVPARHQAYRQQSRQVMARLRALTPLVEQLSIDEAFLDVSAHAASAAAIAHQLQHQIQHELHLPCSLGVATNKLVAKIANNVGKAGAKTSGNYPNAITVVPAGEEAAFLAPLPCEELWGVGPKTAEVLHGLGLQTIGEIAAWPEAALIARLGKHGHDLAHHARGHDERTVEPHRESKSISQETTFTHDSRDQKKLHRVLRSQSNGVAKELRRKSLTATTVKLKLRWSNFETLTRQTTLPQPTDRAEQIYAAAVRLLQKEWTDQLVRLIGVGVSGLGNPARQLSLWEAPEEQRAREKEERLQQTLQALRQRFGDDAVQRGLDADSDAGKE